MVQALRNNWIAAACLLFIVVNTVAIAKEFYWLNLLPAALLVLWAMVSSLERLLLFIVFATPLSINLEQLDLGGIGIALPTEPLMVGIMLLFLLKLALERNVLDPALLRHPVTAVIAAQLLWMAACTVPSEMPVVSLKFLTARMWFVCTMYLVASRLFEDQRNMHRFFWLFSLSLAGVATYTVVRHAGFHFEQDPAHWVMEPFFKDHTSYGAVLAFMVPVLVGAVGMPGYSRTRRGVAFVLLVITTGLVFSYTRAAWVSLVGAIGMFAAMKLRMRPWLLALLLLSAGSVYLVNKDRITIALERNRDESSDDMAEHVSSIGNISSDASNLERINRWNSALRMFEERPVFGWGPGTYMFQYAPFQAAEDRTIISTNFGLNGNAHSEYLGPLAEQGVLGMVLMVLLVVVTSYRALVTWPRITAGEDKRLFMGAYLGLVTYYVHGVLNNYLDLDKASVPFWGFTIMVVLFDIRYAPGREAAA
jgi:O-antigen ligase